MRHMYIALTVTALLLAVAISAYPAAPVSASEPPTPEPPTYTPTPECTPTPAYTPTATPTPDIWDRSSISVSGLCDDDTPVFTITNGGSAMTAPRTFYFLNLDGGASSCAADVANALGSGSFQLGAGESATFTFPDLDVDPPYRICVSQALGHPGTGWASATIGEDDKCVTAEQVVAEPLFGKWLLFLPGLTAGQ